MRERLFAWLRDAGMAGVPDRLSPAACQQVIAAETLAGIDAFVRVFDRVTTRPAWRNAVAADAPEIARRASPEVCFFSAWDFHLPSTRPDDFQLIECNDNGSGFLFAALVNRAFYELGGLAARDAVEPPPSLPEFETHLVAMIEREARAFFGERPPGAALILDDADSLARGRFLDELHLLREILERHGFEAVIAPPEALRRAGGRLFATDRRIAFVVNRSTDFFWEGDGFAPLRAAWREGAVYVAPNPFTYATRSDKRLLEPLSRPDRDAELGIRPEDRAVLSAHVPETWVVREDDVDALVGRKDELVFKPAHGFAARGLLASDQVGRSRLRRLVAHGESYVAQRRVPKRRLTGSGGEPDVWTDLRVWSYRGERFLVSGRASLRADGIDLRAPGGWLPTYAARRAPAA